MPWETLYWLPSLVSGAVALFLAIYICFRLHVRGARSLLVLVCCSVVWSLGYTVELLSVGLEAKVLWAKVNWLGIAFLAPSWFAFVCEYCGFGRWFAGRRVWLLALLPASMVALVWTNGVHHLAWHAVQIEDGHGVSLLAFERGAAHWLYLGISYVLATAGLVLLVQIYLRSAHLYRRQILVLLGGFALPLLSNVVFNTGLSPSPHYDLTPVFTTVTAALWAWGIFRLGLADLVPMVRDAAFESMEDGVIALDAQSRIVEINPAARRLLIDGGREPIGEFCEQLLPALKPAMAAETSVVEEDAWRKEITLDSAGVVRHFEVQVTAILDARGSHIGRLLVLRDISQRVHEEAERTRLVEELEEALAEVKQLSGFLPICAGCKKIRNDEGYWQQVEVYISARSEAEFSHGLCPTCAHTLYPDLVGSEDDEEEELCAPR